jgi:hypothetical protein
MRKKLVEKLKAELGQAELRINSVIKERTSRCPASMLLGGCSLAAAEAM